MAHTTTTTVILIFIVNFCKVEPQNATNSTSWINAQNSTPALHTGREHVVQPKHNPSVPKKGVIQPEESSSVVHTKPLITESDTDYIEANSSKENGIITVDESQSGWVSNKINRAKYVTPIVAVIMSVPFVAVVISIIYKRGADWWQHRNYKRMDFLIDGMYQN